MKLKEWCKDIGIVRLKTPAGYIYWYAIKSGISVGKMAGEQIVACADMTHYKYCPVCGKKKPSS